MASAWCKIEIPETKNLQDIMHEELNTSLRVKRGNTETHLLKPKHLNLDADVEIMQELCGNDPADHFKNDFNSESDSEDLENTNDNWNKYESVMKQFDPVPARMHRNVIVTKTIINGVDKETNLVLNEMINTGLLTKVTIIARGKRAIILCATNDSASNCLPSKYIIKAFKKSRFQPSQINDSTTDNYKCRSKLVTNTVPSKSQYSKAQTEKLYLERLTRAGIPCPEVFWLRRNALVMSYIGRRHPAPTLRQANLWLTDAQIALEQIMQYTKLLYTECNLVHTDLNEDNVLWVCGSGSCYIIDLASAVEAWEENALHLLYRDIKNICQFFTTLKVPNISSPEEWFMEITSCNYLDRISLAELEESIKRKHVRSKLCKSY